VALVLDQVLLLCPPAPARPCGVGPAFPAGDGVRSHTGGLPRPVRLQDPPLVGGHSPSWSISTEALYVSSALAMSHRRWPAPPAPPRSHDCIPGSRYSPSVRPAMFRRPAIPGYRISCPGRPARNPTWPSRIPAVRSRYPLPQRANDLSPPPREPCHDFWVSDNSNNQRARNH